MNRRILRRVTLVAGCLLALCALPVGCGNDWREPHIVPPPPLPERDRSTRLGAVAVFARAHEDRNIDTYAECLHPDYTFWFSEDDRSRPDWNWGEWIGYSIDVDVTERMFETEEVSDIAVDFVNMSVVADAESAEDHFFEKRELVGQDSVTVYWGNFLVDMHVVEEVDSVWVDHWVDGLAYIYLVPDPADESLWTVWRIEDKGNSHRKATESTTWTNLKGMYRK